MNAMRLMTAGLVVCLFGVGAWADEKKTDNAKLLVGKWEVTKSFEQGPPVGALIEFTKDGKLKMAFKMGDEELKMEGTYKLDGDKFSLVMKMGEQEHKKEITIKKISKTEMSTTDEEGKVVELKRTK